MDSTHSFGYWVRRQRKALDLTQRELAERAACSLSAIKKIEQDTRRPSRELAETLATSLAIPESEREQFLHSARRLAPVDQLTVASKPMVPVPEPDTAQAFKSVGNLPTTSAPFFGRDNELEALCKDVLRAESRLITLTGPGGIGKSSLGLEAARLIEGSFPGGAWFVPLAGMEDPSRLSTSIAITLGIAFAGPRDPDEQLLGQLRDRHLLLILDNFEQLLPGGVELISAIISQAPNITLLITSRERLRLQVEFTFPLAGIQAEPARALFAASARRAGWRLEQNEEAVATIDEICRVVGSLPLAIELTASWTRLLSPAEILAELAAGSDLLKSDLRDLPGRHRSMKTIFDASWSRLAAAEQRLLARLAVFAGSFSRDAAAAVCDATLAQLARLYDRSLIYREADRFRLHEVIRQFAAGKLAELTTELAQAEDNHAVYYASYLSQWSSNLRKGGPQSVGWHQVIERDIVNIRLAWRWAVHNIMPERLLPATFIMWVYWDTSGQVVEGAEMFTALGDCARQARDAGRADDAVLRRTEAMALFAQGELNLRQGVSAQKQLQYREQAAALLEGIDAPDERSLILSYLSLARMLVHGPTGAEEPVAEALRLAKRHRHVWNQAVALCFLGLLRLFQGRLEDAREVMIAGDALNEELELHFAKGRNLINLGIVHHALGEYERAQAVQEQALHHVLRLPDNSFVPFARSCLAFHHYAQGKWEKAIAGFQQGLEEAQQYGLLTSVGHSLMGLGLVAAAKGFAPRAVELLTFATSQHDAFKVFLLGEPDRVMAKLKEKLSPAEFAAAEARGRKMTLSEILPEH